MAGNAAIYIADPGMIGSKVFNSLTNVSSYESLSDGETATGVVFHLPPGRVTINFMPGEQIQRHLEGLTGFAQQTITDRDKMLYALSRIYHVQLVGGCVITPDFDQDGVIERFLRDLVSRLNGLLFIHGTIFDYDGERLDGLPVAA
ncbi:MAG: hypothetical protein ACREP4_12885 [Stenotrophomonas sp.]|uniref:hypothetical protein n=1 Tax=Stenotrophomonas sp. TaxID=69392 RepID=UPI003D6D6209